MVLITKPKRPTSIRHQKHRGQHQKQTKPFMNTYWPYLPIMLVVVIGLFINSNLDHRSGNIKGYVNNISSSSLLSSTNNERLNDGAKPLDLNGDLTNAAQAMVNNMVAGNYWSQNNSDNTLPSLLIKQAGYNYTSVGENLAYGFTTSNAILAAWMSSSEHRASVLSNGYQDVGFGISNVNNYLGNGPETIVVAIYGQPANAESSAINVGRGEPIELSQDRLVSEKISRVQVVTNGSATWGLFIVSLVACLAFLMFIIKHGLLWHRVLAKEEAFIISHPWFDVLIVSIGMVGFILTRTAGIIS